MLIVESGGAKQLEREWDLATILINIQTERPMASSDNPTKKAIITAIIAAVDLTSARPRAVQVEKKKFEHARSRRQRKSSTPASLDYHQ